MVGVVFRKKRLGIEALVSQGTHAILSQEGRRRPTPPFAQAPSGSRCGHWLGGLTIPAPTASDAAAREKRRVRLSVRNEIAGHFQKEEGSPPRKAIGRYFRSSPAKLPL